MGRQARDTPLGGIPGLPIPGATGRKPEDGVEKMADNDELNALMEKFLGRVPCDAWQQACGGLGLGFMGEPAFVQPHDCEHGDNCYPAGHPRQFTEDMTLAWLVRDKLAEMFPAAYTAIDEVEKKTDRVWTFRLWDGEDIFWMAEKKTPMLAICRVAEMVMGEQE